MIPGELDPDLSRPRRLGTGVAQAENTPLPKWRCVPTNDPSADQPPLRVYRHHFACISLAYQTADALPTAVTKLNLRVVPETHQDIRDVDVLPPPAHRLDHLVEQLTGRADERLAPPVLLLARRLADEHQRRI